MQASIYQTFRSKKWEQLEANLCFEEKLVGSEAPSCQNIIFKQLGRDVWNWWIPTHKSITFVAHHLTPPQQDHGPKDHVGLEANWEEGVFGLYPPAKAAGEWP